MKITKTDKPPGAGNEPLNLTMGGKTHEEDSMQDGPSNLALAL
jgi:hypothetical protein